MTNAEFVDRVMAHWDGKKDTAEIARLLHEPEAKVMRALRLGREARMLDRFSPQGVSR